MASGFNSLATAAIPKLVASMLALCVLCGTKGYAEEAASRPSLQRFSSLHLGKPLKAPRSYIIKAACPSYSGCCCVIGGYAACMTTIECAALGGGCTGRC